MRKILNGYLVRLLNISLYTLGNDKALHVLINPSAWSDERCLSKRKHHLSWSDEQHSSCCELSLIRLYLDNIGRKCNRTASCVFGKELGVSWCGRVPRNYFFFFSSPLEIWVYFLQSLIAQTALCVFLTRK